MNYKKAIFIFIAAITVFRLVYINLFPLLGDEAYYWQWARHLDWAYYEQGPVLAVVIWLFTLFTKISTVFTVRLGAVVLSAATMVLSFLIYRKMYPHDRDCKENFFNLLFMSSGIVFSAGAVLMMHDTVMTFFYALFIYNFLFIKDKLGEPGSHMHWAHAGIILALGTMSKYTMGTVYFGAIAFLLASGNFRKALKGFIFFSLFYALFMFPSIYWNITHDLATVKYLFIRGGGNSSFTLKYLGELIGAQAGLVSPFLFIFFILAIAKSFENKKSIELMMSVFFLTTITPFLMLRIKSRIEANWPVFTFLPLFFITTRYLFSAEWINNRFRKFYIHFVYITGFLILALLYVHIVTPVLPIPRHMNPLKKAYGLKQLAQAADELYDMKKDEGPVFFAARHYQIASILAFYSKYKPETYIIVPHESSKNYRFWKGYRKLKGYYTIYAYGQGWEHDDMRIYYEKSDIIRKVDIMQYGKKINEFTLDFNTNFLGDEN